MMESYRKPWEELLLIKMMEIMNNFEVFFFSPKIYGSKWGEKNK